MSSFDEWLLGHDSPPHYDDDAIEARITGLTSRLIRVEDAVLQLARNVAELTNRLTNGGSMTDRTKWPPPEIAPDTDPALLSAACHFALRAWSSHAASIIGSDGVREVLMSEFLSVAAATLKPDDITALLRHLSDRIDAGELSATMQ